MLFLYWEDVRIIVINFSHRNWNFVVSFWKIGVPRPHSYYGNSLSIYGQANVRWCNMQNTSNTVYPYRKFVQHDEYSLFLHVPIAADVGYAQQDCWSNGGEDDKYLWTFNSFMSCLHTAVPLTCHFDFINWIICDLGCCKRLLP